MMREILLQVIGIISSSLITFLCGLPQIWGNISLYIHSYYYSNSNHFANEIYNGFGLLNFALGIELFFFLLGLLFFRFISDKIPHILLIAISITITTFTIFLTSFINNLLLFVFVFNCLKGFFIGVLQIFPYKMGPIFLKSEANRTKFKYFNLIFAGFNPFFINIMAQKICNPDNLPIDIANNISMKFPEDISKNFPNFFKNLTLIYLIVGVFIILGLILTRNYRINDNSNHKLQEMSLEMPLIQKESIQQARRTFLKTLFSKEFLKIFFMAVFSSIFIEYFVVYYKEIGFVNYNNDNFLSILGAFCFLFFTIGKVFWKFLSNILNNVRFPLTIIIIIQSLIGFLFKFAANFEGVFFLITCLIFFISGGQYILYEKMVRNTFRDSKHRNILMIFVNFAFTMSLFIIVLIHYIFFENIGFNNLIIVMTLLGFLSFIFVL